MLRAIHALSARYPARAGVPVIDRVDLAIFARRYFTACMECGFCGDWCCSHGVDVDEENVARLLAHADAIEEATGIARTRWFRAEVTSDPEFPGGAYRRTQVEGGACVFLDRERRGCRIHAFCLARGIDYHELKPLVSSLFPLTFDEGLLHPSEEALDGSLVCLDEGPTLYRGVRDELGHAFGPALLAELDALETSQPAAPLPARPNRLPIVR
jgi:hypothetical protein